MFPNMVYAQNFKSTMPQAIFPSNLAQLHLQLHHQQQQQNNSLNSLHENKKSKKNSTTEFVKPIHPSCPPELAQFLNQVIPENPSNIVNSFSSLSAVNQSKLPKHGFKLPTSTPRTENESSLTNFPVPPNSANSSILNTYFNSYFLAVLNQASLSQHQQSVPNNISSVSVNGFSTSNSIHNNEKVSYEFDL